MNKSLVVYFSHDKQNYVSGSIKELDIGNTKIVAEKLQQILLCDLYEIKPLHEYPFHYHECTVVAKEELHQQARPKLTNIVLHMESYENIFLGYPIWWDTMPMCIYTFLESYDFKNKTIYPFCTHEGSGLGNSVKDIQKLCAGSNVEQGLAIHGSKGIQKVEEIKCWLKGFGFTLEQ